MKVLDQMTTGVSIVDARGSVLYANRAVCDQFEVELEDILGRPPIQEQGSPAERAMWARELSLRESGADDPYLVRSPLPGGRVVVGVIKPEPVFDKGGRYLGSLGIFIPSRSSRFHRVETARVGGRSLFELMQAAHSFSRGSHSRPDADDRISGREKGAGLTPREVEIARLLLDGHAPNEVRERLAISIHTVHAHLRGLRKKVDARNVVELIAKLRALLPEGEDQPGALL